jgi:biotin carboxylase
LIHPFLYESISNVGVAVLKGFFISIGGGVNQLPLILKCKEMGLDVIVIDSNPDAVGFAHSSLQIIESIYEYRKIFHKISSLPFLDKVIGVGCRSFGKATVTAAYISEKLQLPGLGVNLANQFLDKKIIKGLLKQEDIRLPEAYMFSAHNKRIKFPCIMKPVGGSGKSGIRLLQSRDELKQILKSGSVRSLIIEEYIDGQEVTVMGFCDSQEFHLVSIIDKITTNEPPFLEKSHRLPSANIDIIGEIKLTLRLIMKKLGLKNCPIVAEFKINKKREPYLIELVPEIGGEYLAEHLLWEHYHYDYFLDYINLMIGKKVSCTIPNKYTSDQKKTMICFLPPRIESKKYIGSNTIETKDNENFFLDKELKKVGTEIEYQNGNSSRVRVVGLQYGDNLSMDEKDEQLRERLGAKFE